MKIGIALLIFTIVFCGCETTKEAKKKTEIKNTYRGLTIEFQYPPSATVANDVGDGFQVNYVRVGEGKNMLGIYEGQRPQLFSKKEQDLTMMRRGTTSRKNIERGNDVWGVDSNGKLWRESVWNVIRPIKMEDGKNISFPITVHLWYFGVNEEEQAVFDSIIDTIEITH